MPGLGTEQYPSSWMPWHMGIAGAGLESQMRLRRCGWLQGRKEPRWTRKGSLREVLERKENFHLAFPASCHVPRAQQLGGSPSAWSLVFLHEFFISGKEPLSLTGAAMGACFPSIWRQSRWRIALRQKYLSLERGRALCAPGGTAPIPYYCRFPSFRRRLGYCFFLGGGGLLFYWDTIEGREKPTRLLCSWDFPGKDTGVGCHFLLQGIFPTQGSNLCLLHWHVDYLPLSHSGNPWAELSFPQRYVEILTPSTSDCDFIWK